jgi:hypothetical protein
VCELPGLCCRSCGRPLRPIGSGAVRESARLRNTSTARSLGPPIRTAPSTPAPATPGEGPPGKLPSADGRPGEAERRHLRSPVPGCTQRVTWKQEAPQGHALCGPSIRCARDPMTCSSVSTVPQAQLRLRSRSAETGNSRDRTSWHPRKGAARLLVRTFIPLLPRGSTGTEDLFAGPSPGLRPERNSRPT